MQQPELSIIVISYNTKVHTINTLESVYKHTKGINFELIVIDNDSKDGSIDELKKYSKGKKNLILKITGKNPGFGATNNYGSSIAKGKYLLFLNSDTIIQDDVIKTSLEYLSDNKDVGIYSCRLLNKDGSLQPSGGFFPTLFKVFVWQFFLDDLPVIGRIFNSIHPHPHYYQQVPIVLDWVTGAFMMMPKKVFQELNGFDDHIFMYTEEMELCYRANREGYKIVYNQEKSITHLGGESSPRGVDFFGSFLSITSEIEYTIYFFQKHKPKWQILPVKLIFFFGSLLRYLIFGLIKNKEVARRSYLYVLKNIA